MDNSTCPFCNSILNDSSIDDSHCHNLYDCPVCGHYKRRIYPSIFGDGYEDEIAAYLYYNGIHGKINGERIQYVWLDETPHVIDEQAWYRDVNLNEVLVFSNLSFSEMIDQILQAVANKSPFYSAAVSFSYNELQSLLFVKRHLDTSDYQHESKQIVFLLDYLDKKKLISVQYMSQEDEYCHVVLSAEGWNKVDERNSHPEKSRTAFVAMSFAEEMSPIREAIKDAITECQFSPIIMDEVEHNHQIVPEMLHEIRNARFVIAELTGNNNGAYYEAGYALGLGKEVIQLCSETEVKSRLHFDVKQVNTIIWKDEHDLKQRLVKRINATIG